MRKLKIAILGFVLIAGISSVAKAQILRDYVNDAEHDVNNYPAKKKKKHGNPLSESEVSDGLKQALQIGAQNAGTRVSVVNGFFGNGLIKILMPSEAKKVENTLRQVGMGEQVDKAILSMNRAAEDASAKAAPIIIDAIKNMTIEDAMAILHGGNDAATQYLKNKTAAALTAAFRPIVEESLDKVNATKYWADIFNAYNDLPTTNKKVNPNLEAYVTERTLNGLFVTIADEEAKIRMNPAARVTDLLQRVFGAK